MSIRSVEHAMVFPNCVEFSRTGTSRRPSSSRSDRTTWADTCFASSTDLPSEDAANTAGNLYGWSILLRGTPWPGPRIGKRLSSTIRLASDQGHEIGVHAWDHHLWQMKVETLGPSGLDEQIRMAFDCLGGIIGRSPDCSAVPGWRCTDGGRWSEAEFLLFRYRDCR